MEMQRGGKGDVEWIEKGREKEDMGERDPKHRKNHKRKLAGGKEEILLSKASGMGRELDPASEDQKRQKWVFEERN